MSIEQEKIVDLIGDDNNTNEVVMFVMDHLPWNDQDGEHLVLLQKKINSYLAFIESGELVQTRPDAVSRKKVVEIQAKYELSDLAKRFYEQAKEKMRDAGIELRYKYVGA